MDKAPQDRNPGAIGGDSEHVPRPANELVGFVGCAPPAEMWCERVVAYRLQVDLDFARRTTFESVSEPKAAIRAHCDTSSLATGSSGWRASHSESSAREHATRARQCGSARSGVSLFTRRAFALAYAPKREESSVVISILICGRFLNRERPRFVSIYGVSFPFFRSGLRAFHNPSITSRRE